MPLLEWTCWADWLSCYTADRTRPSAGSKRAEVALNVQKAAWPQRLRTPRGLLKTGEVEEDES